ncbi:MAG: hypothetical protein GTO41_05480 [Burkholderiales bacterium]|nr:hypothetical protein [Burkholderiales bacterium]
MRVFIAGVMQGSRIDDKVSDQRYRETVARILRENLGDVDIIDPWALHPNSESYSLERARETFFSMNALAAQADAVVAYLPEASMGTAVEMWQAYSGGVKVYCISPMTQNWVVKLLSSRIFPTLEAFESFARNGGLAPA